MSSNLLKTEDGKRELGMFDNTKSYVFTNWSNEPFEIKWNTSGSEPIHYIVKAGDWRELPQYLAFHATKHFVNREMLKENPMRTDLEDSACRDPYEQKTLTLITDPSRNPARDALKEQIRKEVLEEIKAEKAEEKPKTAKKADKKEVIEVATGTEKPAF